MATTPLSGRSGGTPAAPVGPLPCGSVSTAAAGDVAVLPFRDVTGPLATILRDTPWAFEERSAHWRATGLHPAIAAILAQEDVTDTGWRWHINLRRCRLAGVA